MMAPCHTLSRVFMALLAFCPPLLVVVAHRTLDQSLFSGTLPSQLGKISASQGCRLTPSQCEAFHQQPCTGNNNDFSCPVPQLSPTCSENLGLTCLQAPSPPPTSPHAASLVAIDALTSLYKTTSGANWNGNVGNTNWLVGDPCQNAWVGVTCNGAGEITDL